MKMIDSEIFVSFKFQGKEINTQFKTKVNYDPTNKRIKDFPITKTLINILSFRRIPKQCCNLSDVSIIAKLYSVTNGVYLEEGMDELEGIDVTIPTKSEYTLEDYTPQFDRLEKIDKERRNHNRQTIEEQIKSMDEDPQKRPCFIQFYCEGVSYGPYYPSLESYFELNDEMGCSDSDMLYYLKRLLADNYNRVGKFNGKSFEDVVFYACHGVVWSQAKYVFKL